MTIPILSIKWKALERKNANVRKWLMSNWLDFMSHWTSEARFAITQLRYFVIPSGTTCSMKQKVVTILMFVPGNIGGLGQKQCYNFFIVIVCYGFIVVGLLLLHNNFITKNTWTFNKWAYIVRRFCNKNHLSPSYSPNCVDVSEGKPLLNSSIKYLVIKLKLCLWQLQNHQR